MRWFQRAIPDSSEETTETPPAEPDEAETEIGTPPFPKGSAKYDLALALAQYGAKLAASEREEIQVVSEEAPMIRLANTILQQAIKEGASQILIEPDGPGLRVRYRVDGVLHNSMTMPWFIKSPLIARYLHLAEMSLLPLTEPQSGRIAISYESLPYDLRVNTMPTEHGLSFSMRILDKRKVLDGLKTLGISNEVHVQLDDLIQAPSGIFLSVGPVACGKSTTLYSLLSKLNTVERFSAAIQSEAEYQLGGVTAARAGGKTGMSYPQAFRGLVRAGANVIVAERLPDATAWNAALTASEAGVLVLASLTLPDAITALRHLRKLELDAERISQNIRGILSQRLVRRICPNCKEFYDVTVGDLKPLGLRRPDPAEKITLARGAGCEQCNKTGYKGQIGLFSLLRMNQEIGDKIVRGDFSPDLFEAALANGMHELREDGLEKILLGQTTVDEVFRVVGI